MSFSPQLGLLDVCATREQVAYVIVGGSAFEPRELEGLLVVRTANDDKRADVDLRVQLAAPSTLYVGFDVRGSTLPSWLQGWELVPGWLITTTDTDFRVYRKRFPDGEASLGNTDFGKGSYSMYVIAID